MNQLFIPREWSMLKKLLAVHALTGSSSLVEDTATGNPLTFETDVGKPLKSLSIPFTPIQSGTGDPSPQNIRSILPWNGLKVFDGGKSLFPFVKTEYEATSNYNGYDTKNAIPDSFIGQKLTYSAYFDNTNSAEPSSVRIWGKDKNDSWIWLGSSGNEIGAGAKETSYNTILIPRNIAWIGFGMNMKAGSKYSQPMVELGQTATAYEPYVPITDTDIVFPSPVYGGKHEAVSGVLENGWWSLDVAWSDRWYGQQLTNVERRVFRLPTGIIPKTESYYKDHKGEILCNIAKWTWSFNDDNVHFYVAKDGANYIAIVFLPIGTPEDTRIQIVGTLATPQEKTLTGHQITAIVGDNTIWSDADGSMTAIYYKKG